MKTDLEDKWDKNVQEAKIYLKSNHLNQISIAKLALEVCEVKHGGNSTNLYTIARFAKELNISEKTLQNWCIVKRNVYDKLSPDLKAKIKYREILQTAKLVTKDTSVEQVNKRAYDSIYRFPLDNKLLRYCASLKALAYNFSRMEAAQRADIKTTQEVAFYCTQILKSLKLNGADVTPINHGLTAKQHNSSISELGNVKDGNNLTDKDEKVYKYLLSRNGPSTPTAIGQTVGKHNKSNASAWALRSLNKLIKAGLVTRVNNGSYFATSNKNIKPQYLDGF